MAEARSVTTENEPGAEKLTAEAEVREPGEGESRQLSAADILQAWDAEVEELRAERERAAAAIEAYRQQMLRLQADFDNFRKRKGREEQELGNAVTERLLKKFLPILDNLERALVAPPADGESLSKGVEMIFRQLKEVLQEEGVSYCAARGELFNPEIHHAVAQVETEEYAAGTVVDELQKGYLFKGRLLRPALVRVATRPSEKVLTFHGKSSVEEGEGNGQSNRD